MTFKPRENFTEAERGSTQPNTFAAGFNNIATVQDKTQHKTKIPDKEMNDERIKRMRAYQQFLRIQENEKNSKGLLEDFGSNVIDILKVPV